MSDKVPSFKMTTPIPASITTPDSVDSSIGKLEFFDGVPKSDTVTTVYDYLDRARAVEVFVDSIPLMSMAQLRRGQADAGAKASNQVCIWDTLMDSTSLVLTGNTSTMYAVGFLALDTDGPTVVDLPTGMLGILNDMAFLYMQDLGVAGPDKGKGGKYVILPPDYKGDVPDGYYVVKSKSYGVWLFMRGYLTNGIKAASDNIRDHLKVYPLSKADNPPAMEFVNVSGNNLNTVVPNDDTYFEKLNELIQGEAVGFLDPERAGRMAAIGIVKGQPFKPDERMKKILADAAAIGNAAARAITFYPRYLGQRTYQDSTADWLNVYADNNCFFENEGARVLDARAWYHYNCICVSPAMGVPKPGTGSSYTIGTLDSKHKAVDGSKTYKLHLPKDVPVKDFWAVTIYDTQTRSQLQTDQQFPTVGSQDKGMKANPDGSYDIYFGPTAPEGWEGNWLQTIPGKSWLIALRMYGPLEPWLNQTWRPSQIELVE